MHINVTFTGKTNQESIKELILNYVKKLKHYSILNINEISDIKGAKSLTNDQLKAKEAEIQLNKINEKDYLILLDEKGVHQTSKEFAEYLQMKMNSGLKSLHFLIGGAYGFDQKIYDRANYKISLSKMTFSHQMVRLFFIEQLYRAHTILRNEKYHHD